MGALGMSTFLVSIVSGILVALLLERNIEISLWLIRLATAALPETERARKREQFLSDNAATKGDAWKLLHAAGCIWVCMSALTQKFIASVWSRKQKNQYQFIEVFPIDYDGSYLTALPVEEALHCILKLNRLPSCVLGDMIAAGEPTSWRIRGDGYDIYCRETGDGSMELTAVSMSLESVNSNGTLRMKLDSGEIELKQLLKKQ